MINWWSGMTLYNQIWFILGVVFTTFMLFQFILVFAGSDSELDNDGVSSYDGIEVFGLKLLTMRTFVAFVAIGSWMIYILNGLGVPTTISTLIGLGSGLAAAILSAMFMKKIIGLQTSGNTSIKHAVGKSGEVYLTIPPLKSGTGKVSVYMEDRYIECDAMTYCEDSLITGTTIKVVGVVGENVLLVAKLM